MAKKAVEEVQGVASTFAGLNVNLDEVEEVAIDPELSEDAQEEDEAEEFFEAEDGEGEDPESPFGVWSKETASRKPLKVLLYGPAGAGKTTYAATFPDPVFLDLEGGLRSTTEVKPVLRFPPNPEDEIVSTGQVGEFYNICRRYSPREAPFKTIVIDSLNELQVLVTKKVLATYPQSRQMEDQLTYQDYGKIGRDVLKIIAMFLKLPYHIVFTAVETPREYEGQAVYPKFAGKMVWPELQRWVEQIGYVHSIRGEDGKPQHVVSYHLSPQYAAKTRLKISERYLPNHYDALHKYVLKSLNEPVV